MPFRYLQNSVTILVTGPQLGRFLNLCANRGILLWDVHIREEGCSMKMYAKDFFQLKGLLKKTGGRVKILQKRGFRFWLNRQEKRKLFLIGPFLSLFLLWLFSQALWTVRIYGNEEITGDILGDFLASRGVYYGMPLADIPLEEIKSGLREEFEEINWVSLSIEGTALEIRMKENDVEEEEEGAADINLVSPVAGTVKSVLIRQGTALVKVGDEVGQGQLLIEGKIPIYDENGELKRTEYCIADGDVVIQSQLTVEDELALDYEQRIYTGRVRRKYYLEGKEKRLGLDIRPIPYERYDVVEERKTLTLFGGLTLPFTLCRIDYREFTIEEARYSREEGESLLREEWEKNIADLEEKGVQILSKNVKIEANDISLNLQGSITVLQTVNPNKGETNEDD